VLDRIWNRAVKLPEHVSAVKLEILLIISILRRNISMSEEVLSKIKAIIAELLDIDEGEIKPESRFREDLEADSLDLVELIMEFEEAFGSEISDEDAQKITTVGEAVDYVKAQM
jgi:acyl carrier protein